jgi:hypothetical protein
VWPQKEYLHEKIFIAGDFTNWEFIEMRQLWPRTGILALPCHYWEYYLDFNTLKLPRYYKHKLSPGTYEYKFFIHNQWIHDTSMPTKMNVFGTYNNVITIN